ncbi:MerR family transcriptional regulator [Kitasatospora sp. NBC_00240]|uniref:MerR family transcriptional regulator n=1 Tax=Kitasatospora sp. NBC_00240 TaxID=2903567 RepID=UPI002252DD0E|nr:MerR family transcriptional regulator [Kitasatospora sp. NBC_00240]MCX5215221.1 MerR family transcriptional regulator [Kitasatospora sp. NBC_00240]
MADTLSPAEVVERSGFSIDTLRYYERIGLLDRIDRTVGGRRQFNESHLDWLGVLRCLRDTGMPIAEMQRYADSARGGDATLAERLELLTEHAARVERTIAELRRQQQHLAEKIAWYQAQIHIRPGE